MSLFDELWRVTMLHQQNKDHKTYLKRINQAKKAANRGKWSITCRKLSDKVIEMLQQDKLNVTFHNYSRGFFQPGTYYRVDWRKPPEIKDVKNER